MRLKVSEFPTEKNSKLSDDYHQSRLALTFGHLFVPIVFVFLCVLVFLSDILNWRSKREELEKKFNVDQPWVLGKEM